ncbi:MAG: hypothetical protein IPP71_05360 [Bacteroidetes bacterium]|nr:hypothetical protein [Bacteroidota bacterium]
MHKKLLITFDYELYLGNRSGTINDCMIDPTNQLIDVMGKHNIHAIFFVDTTYLLRLKEQAQTTTACRTDFETIASQLRNLVQKGHYVFPHIHPHWLDAQYLPEINQWRLNNIEKYRFHNVSEPDRSKVFDGSILLLQEILLPQFPNYKIDAYRAGGWGIQPFTDFLPFFKKHGIIHEFSVLGGIYQFTDAQLFDFSDAPEKSIYRFNEDVCKEDKNGPFIQYNISSIKISPFTTFLNKVWIKVLFKLFSEHTFHKGEGQPSRIVVGKSPASSKGSDLSNSVWERISVELLTSVKLNIYRSFWEKNEYMHFISHPKMITGHNLTVFNKFLNSAFEKYSVETDFYKMLPE